MNCFKDIPLWTSVTQNPSQYPWVASNITCDVAIIGGGITGALCAVKFAQEKINCVLVDAKTIGNGQSSQSIGILGFPKKTIKEIAEKFGMDKAIKIFKLYSQSVDNIETLCEGLHGDVEFERKDIFTYNYKSQEQLKKEFLIKKHNDFPVEFLSESKCMEYFSFFTNGGIYCENFGGEINPFLFNHAVIAKSEELGARIYENTPIKAILKTPQGNELFCQNGYKIICKKVIIATNLDNSKANSEQIKKSNVVYTLVTKPVENFKGWKDKCIIEDFSDKNLTIRTTHDNRIAVMGLNSLMLKRTTFSNELIDVSSLILKKKINELENTLINMFPAIKNITPEYAYYSDLNNKSPLPLVGIDKENPNCFYSINNTINNISSCEISSKILLDLYTQQKSQDLNLFTK